MHASISYILGTLLALFSLQGHTQPKPHPGAESALEKIVLEQAFGNDLELHSRETVDLLLFYRAERARLHRGLFPIGDRVIWKTGENGYFWTDGEHFMVGLGGSPSPPEDMLEAWLQLIDSNPSDLARMPNALP